MTLDDVSLFRYTLPLTHRLHLGEHTISEREGLLIRLRTASGAEGWGEAAPLPGFSAETLPEAERQLRQVASTLRGQRLQTSGGDGHDPWMALELDDGLAASVRFAVEAATVDVAAAAVHLPVHRLLSDTARQSLSLNALLDGDPDEIEEKAERVRDAGYAAVKMKVGRDDPDYEAAAVRILHDILGPGVAIRLDANRAWTLPEAVAFAEDVRAVPIQYVEEPLADPHQLPDFARRTGLPIALDETTREMQPGQFGSFRNVRAVVLKPTLLGGMRAASAWAHRALRANAAPVFSASYESGVGLRMLVAQAVSLGRADVPAGLDTYRRLRHDLVDPPLDLDGPFVDVDAMLAGPVTLDDTWLETVG